MLLQGVAEEDDVFLGDLMLALNGRSRTRGDQGVKEAGGGVRSGPGEARTILLLHIIGARPSKQPLMVRTFVKVYTELGSYFVSARTNRRHHWYS